MPALTPAERRGALVVALLLLIGATYDWVRGREAPAPRDASAPEVAAPVLDSALAAGGDSPVPAVRPAEAPPGTRLDLNRATAAELDALPGIGPVLAARIIEHRKRHGPFRRTDDLLAITGIGPTLFARLEPRVAVDSPAPTRSR